MKILLLSNAQLKDALTHLGHEVTVRTDDAVEKLDVTHTEADLIIVHESLGMRHLPHGIEKTCVPTVFYSVDVHLNLYWHREYAQLFDYVFVAQKDYVPQLSHENAFWLPASIHPGVFKDHHLERTHDMVFIGTIDEHRKKRKNILRELQKRFDVKVFGTDPGDRLSHTEMAKIYSQAKIALNESILGEITFRTFEAMACGPMLLTERVENGLADLFEDGKEIITYDYHDIIEKADYFLNHPEERITIAEKGKHKVLKNHTSCQSAATMLAALNKNNFRKREAAQYKVMLHYGKALYFTGSKFPRHKARRLRRAESILKKTRLLFPDEYEPAVYLALAYAAKNSFARALEELRIFNAKGAENFFVLAALACLEFREGSMENAQKYYYDIFGKNFSTPDELYMNLALEYEKKGFLCAVGLVNSDGIPLHAIDCYFNVRSLEGRVSAALLYYKLGLFESACAHANGA
ncbi:MAG: glycosyltransferase [Pseudomonadota bacterium]